MNGHVRGRGWLVIGCALAEFCGPCAPLATAGNEFQNGWKAFRDPTIQNYGYQWANIGHAGNADWVGLGGGTTIVRVGGVGYRYRIAKTEVTNRQWFEFVQAYAPFVSDQFYASNQFTGLGIGVTGGGGYVLAEQVAEHGATVGWRFAARYVNWLHNGKVNEQWAFESGVYDTSTFGDNGGPITDQIERSEGARYFLPTRDEWAKAVHFDSDRYGPDQEGYWLYAYSSDTAAVPGAPGTPGAQTNAGTLLSYPVMSYPDSVTPWGLWDASGSVREWLETINPSGWGRYGASSDATVISLQGERINAWEQWSPSSLIGIRLASVVPGPGTLLVALPIGLGLLSRRSRRACCPSSNGCSTPSRR